MSVMRIHPTVRRRARRLRSNMTDAERRLWSLLRQQQISGHRFRRQHPCGPFILDFVCLDAKLVIEVDGGQHGELEQQDNERSAWLARQGFRVLRFWNHDVLKTPDAVGEAIMLALASDIAPPPLPSP